MGKNRDGQIELILENRQVLLIFFVIVALCGVFFSLGYLIGRNTFSSSTTVAQATPQAAGDADKPSAMPPPAYLQQGQRLASDTAESIDRLVFDGFREMSPSARLRSASQSFRAIEKLSIAGLRHQYPDASEEELRRRAGARRLGRELTLRAFGPEAEAWLD